jgi:membrane protein YqaA with SNARE-associated domain
MMKKNKFLFFASLISIFMLFFMFYQETKIIFITLVSIFGLSGLFIFVIILDTIIQPLSPDLLVFGSTFGGANLYSASLVGGFGSVIAGILGYFIGKKIGAAGFRKWFGDKHLKKGKKFFKKYGIWAIIVGAISPIPYSSVCWAAGIYKMRFFPFLISSIVTRIPRFFLMGYIGYHL